MLGDYMLIKADNTNHYVLFFYGSQYAIDLANRTCVYALVVEWYSMQGCHKCHRFCSDCKWKISRLNSIKSRHMSGCTGMLSCQKLHRAMVMFFGTLPMFPPWTNNPCTSQKKKKQDKRKFYGHFPC